MKRTRRRLAASSFIAGAALASIAAISGCTRDDPNQLLPGGATGGSTSSGGASCAGMGEGGSSGTTTSSSTGGTTTTTTGGAMTTTGAGTGGADTTSSTGSGGEPPKPKTVLDDRVLSYTEALRTASFKLVGNAPTLQQIEDLKKAADPAKTYADMVDAMMNDVRFSKQMLTFWRNTMRMGGAAGGGKPSRETAPTFAARITVEGRPYTDLFTANTNTCPTFDGMSFKDGNCDNGPITAGVLTDPGALAQYYGNLAFRRVRFIQETFACRKQPAELTDMPVPMGAGNYTSPWPFASIAGTDNGGRVDFHDVSSAICANCHSTSNHRAPLMANYDAAGKYQDSIQVHVPIAGEPMAVLSDWLPQTPIPEPTAWKFGMPAKDIGEMGAQMAADDEVAACAVARMWNYAMSKGDIVIDAASVPTEVIGPLVQKFKANGYNLRFVIKSAFTHDDFVRF